MSARQPGPGSEPVSQDLFCPARRQGGRRTGFGTKQGLFLGSSPMACSIFLRTKRPAASIARTRPSSEVGGNRRRDLLLASGLTMLHEGRRSRQIGVFSSGGKRCSGACLRVLEGGRVPLTCCRKIQQEKGSRPERIYHTLVGRGKQRLPVSARRWSCWCPTRVDQVGKGVFFSTWRWPGTSADQKKKTKKKKKGIGLSLFTLD